MMKKMLTQCHEQVAIGTFTKIVIIVINMFNGG